VFLDRPSEVAASPDLANFRRTLRRLRGWRWGLVVVCARRRLALIQALGQLPEDHRRLFEQLVFLFQSLHGLLALGQWVIVGPIALGILAHFSPPGYSRRRVSGATLAPTWRVQFMAMGDGYGRAGA
jgi:hypothetical protein